MTEGTPDNFDWVVARLRCSPFDVFKDVQRGVEADVTPRNEALTTDERRRGIGFQFKVEGGERGLLLRPGHRPEATREVHPAGRQDPG